MSLSKEITAITECSICTESFVDPRILPCVHTFCLKCLESYGKSRNSGENLTCPICRANFAIPTMKFADLPVNFFIQKLLEVNKIASGPSSNNCDSCCDQNDSACPASVYCFDCRQSLCDQCCQVHNKLRCIRSHQVVEFGKKQAEELLKASPTFCNAHQDEMVKFYCSDCKATICMSCYVEEHSSHKCSSILKVADGFLEQLKEDTCKVSQQITACFSEEENLKKKKTEFLKDIKRKKLQISETVKELHHLVDVYGEQVLAELKSIAEVKLKEFEVTKDEIHGNLMVMESFKRYSDEVMAKATPADITRLANMLEKRAAELHAIRLDNDFCVFDVEITSSNLKHLLIGKVDNPVCDFVVCNSRRDNGKAFALPYAIVPIPVAQKKAVIEMSTIGQELYLLSRGITATTERKRIIGSETVKLPLPSSINSPNGTYYLTNCTKCDSMIFLLQLWLFESSSGDTLKLQVSNLSLAESDGIFETFVTFNLPPSERRQPSNISQDFILKSPQKLNGYFVYGIYFNPRVSCTGSALTVQPSILFYTQNSTFQEELMISIPLSTTPQTQVSSSILLEVYDTQADPLQDVSRAIKTIGAAIIRMKLQDTFTNAEGSSTQRTNYTQSDSILLHLQLNLVELPSDETATLELKISKLNLSDSGGIFMPAANLAVQPYGIHQPIDADHDITLKATQKLINAGFYGIHLRLHVGTTQDAVKVEGSVLNISAKNEDYPSEAKINIPTSTSTGSLTLRRTINLPSTLDPSGMVSCNYYQSIYIGDRQSSSICRVEPTGRIKKWPVAEAPDGLSVTPDHTLIVTFSKSLKLIEYDTYGALLRDIKLTGLCNPIHSVVITDDRFLVITGSAPLYLASAGKSTTQRKKMQKGEENLSEEADVKKMIIYANSDTKLDPVTSEELNSESSKATVVVQEVTDQSDIQSKELSAESEVQLKGPVHAVTDRFGFVFVLTTDDAKVHLLSPQLNYIRELISLHQHGMEKPSRIHFHDESGILYVESKVGCESLLGFQVTEGKVDPSVWKKDGSYSKESFAAEGKTNINNFGS